MGRHFAGEWQAVLHGQLMLPIMRCLPLVSLKIIL